MVKLKRSVTLPALVFYGVGTMVGGGIYALIGEVVAQAGQYAPISMLLAGLVALLSAMTFAELSARFPHSAGPAFYAEQAFQRKALGAAVGWMIVATGVVSAATLTVAVAGFLFELVGLPLWIGTLLSVSLLAAVAISGIQQSVVLVSVITVVEVLGLLAVTMLNADAISFTAVISNFQTPEPSLALWVAIIGGSFIAFYSFIGFEDMVSLAEEVKQAPTNLPRGILISLAITWGLYILISVVAVNAVELSAYATTKTPMTLLVADSAPGWGIAMALISLLAGVNGALVQIIMASRVLFGMSKERQAPGVFSYLLAKRQTPLIASLFAAILVFLFASALPLAALAKLTSSIILIVFTITNFALWNLKARVSEAETYSGFSLPRIVPFIAALVTLSILIFQLAT